jgi:hypothetical protein
LIFFETFQTLSRFFLPSMNKLSGEVSESDGLTGLTVLRLTDKKNTPVRPETVRPAIFQISIGYSNDLFTPSLPNFSLLHFFHLLLSKD